jgi:nucleoside-diphosphate-sugar epimerase
MIQFPWFGGKDKSPSKGNNRDDSPVLVDRADAADAVETRPGYRAISKINQATKSSIILVTGSSGLCGARLVEMLVTDRGVHHVIAFDLQPPSTELQRRFDAAVAKAPKLSDSRSPQIHVCSGYDHGDITNIKAVEYAFALAQQIRESEKPNQGKQASADAATQCRSVDAVIHLAALVGPFYQDEQYRAVNYDGTLHVIQMCQQYNVPRLVYSSSPSTRFTGSDIAGQREDELKMPEPGKFLARYAETKAYGEKAVSDSCYSVCADKTTQLVTISVAPHQIYGPYDTLFLTKILETSGNGRLRIFGAGRNKISICYVDNYCHGLCCGLDKLDEPQGHPSHGKFYIITDNEDQLFWEIINEAGIAMGFTDLTKKFHLPVWLLYALAYVCDFLSACTGGTIKFKLNPFNVKMLTIHRYFSIENAIRDLQYEPILPFSTAWPQTLAWFRANWLPQFLSTNQASPLAPPPPSAATGSTKKED